MSPATDVEGPPSPMDRAHPGDARRERTLLAGAFLAAVLVTASYIAVTGHVWEDYFITFRASRNLAEGHGLSFNPDERVHSFTSPIGVLLPALFYAATGGSEAAALWGFRGIAVLAFAIGVTIAVRIARLPAPGLDRAAGVVAALLIVTDLKSVAFTTNGMENGIMILGLAGALFGCTAPRARWGWLAASWACLQWTRPDAFVYAAAIAIAALVAAPLPRSELWGRFRKALPVALVAYLPWLLWSWEYYGSPIPHTITAKAGMSAQAAGDAPALAKQVLEWLPEVFSLVFEPIYARFGGWPTWSEGLGLAAGLAVMLFAIARGPDRVGRTAAIAFVLASLYLAYVGATAVAFPWYLPNAAFLAFVALARAPSAWLSSWLPARTALLLARGLQAIGVGAATTLLLLGAWQIRVQQREIEWGTRRDVSLWLRDHVEPGETVYLEAIGYIGYFSNCRIDDWPGLVSPRVVALRREFGTDLFTTIPRLGPDWLVLRPHEARRALALPEVGRDYLGVAVFDATPRLAGYTDLPGLPYLQNDATWIILHRRRATSPAAPGAPPPDAPAPTR